MAELAPRGRRPAGSPARLGPRPCRATPEVGKRPDPRPLDRLPGARRRREPARPDGPASRGHGRRRPPVLALGRSTRGFPPAPPLRDVARGPGAGHSRAESGRARRPLADLLARAEGALPPGAEPAREASGTWRNGASKPASCRGSCVARCADRRGRRHPAQLAGRGATSSSGSSGRAQGVHSGRPQRGRSPLRGCRPRALPLDPRRRRLRALRRPDRAEEERPRADPRRTRRRACRSSILSATPRRATRSISRVVPRGRAGVRDDLVRRRSTTTTRGSPRPSRRRGSSRCRAGSRRPGSPPWRPRWRGRRSWSDAAADARASISATLSSTPALTARRDRRCHRTCLGSEARATICERGSRVASSGRTSPSETAEAYDDVAR